MLLSGTTCFTDMYYFSEETAREAVSVGMRANIGMAILSFPTAWAKTDAEYLEKSIKNFHEFQGNPLVRVWFGPHAPYTVSDELFKSIFNLSQEYGIPVMCHIHETEKEVVDGVREYGMRPIARLDKLGLVNDKLLAIHCTQLIQEEIELFSKKGTSVVTCPESNSKLASGICPVHTLQTHGVNTCIGTDSAASNNELDMFGEMKMTAFIGKLHSNRPDVLSASTVLSMATINGAKAVGLDRDVGSLEVGKAADIVCVDLESLFTVPIYNPITHLVYSVGRESVTDVWINGNQVVRNKSLLCYDIEHLLHLARKWGDEIYHTTYLIQNPNQ
eukprot:TRINITY_DN2141_c0_g2_i10.p1 TRINITY_DN2141_c0_g2~~TRINITY_DN2141_c0_g2_i10.p1  ORF type:complete len:331 (+),score=70.37 TRINITY_DN2141_c0_g2_i10:280-1272(+)